MKKLVSILLAVLMIVNTALAYTSTVQVKGIGISVTSDENVEIEITPKTSEITGWTVKTGNTTVVNNKFIMPSGDVVIEGVMQNGYKLTVEMPDFTRIETKEEGKSITVEAITTNDNYTFKNWTATGITLTSSQQTSKTITFTMPGNDVKLVANYVEGSTTPETYTITYDVNNGTGTIASQTKTKGVDLTLTTDKPTRSGYNFLGWSTSSSATTAIYTSGATFTTDANTILYAVWKARTVNSDTSGANAPVVIDGLTPVNWNGTDWVATTEANWEYNYNSVAQATQTTVAGNKDGAWANAQTADGSLYVWIPRYAYKITSGYHSSGDSWNSLDDSGTNKIEIKFSNGINDDVTSGATNASEGYIKHPAFKFGDEELKGIWVAKYEASKTSSSNTSSVVSKPTATNYVAQAKPEVDSWREISVSKMFKYAYNTFRNADSHLMRNSEWGAVAYLTSAIGRIPYVNNYYVYTYSSARGENVIYLKTGHAGETQDAKPTGISGNENSWNTIEGVKASTTHNLYGIYDMSGGAYECMAAYCSYGSSQYLADDTDETAAGTLYLNRETKYVEVYDNSNAYSSSQFGDAIYEVSNRNDSSNRYAWDSDSITTPEGLTAVFVRGGVYDNGFASGIFSSNADSGTDDERNSFRVVLSAQ